MNIAVYRIIARAISFILLRYPPVNLRGVFITVVSIPGRGII
ncbi:MAG: hypothetical protein QXJ97_03705 [Desulfurococcaceae archaeon]